MTMADAENRSPAARMVDAGNQMIARADESDTIMGPLLLETGELLKMAGEAIGARDIEIGVLRTELAFVNERANTAAANARAWFERHEDLVKQLAAAKAA